MRIPSLIVLAVAAAACAGDAGNMSDTGAPAVSATATDSATAAANISNAIAANPAAADSILRANGHTAESFEQLLFDIAADSGMSARYAAAKTGSR